MSLLHQFAVAIYLFISGIILLLKDDTGEKSLLQQAVEHIEVTLSAEENALKRFGQMGPGSEEDSLNFLSSNPTVKEISEHAMVQLYALERCKERLMNNGSSCADFWSLVRRRMCSDAALRRYGDANHRNLDECPFETPACPMDDYPYRTFDGSCNSKKDPGMGMANRAFKRYLPPDYADCVGAPRRSKTGQPLPSPRHISNVLYQTDTRAQSPLHTTMHMTFGQLLDHDLDRTAVSKFMDPETNEMLNIACGDGCSSEGIDNIECLPIAIPENDPLMRNKTCLKFVRSQQYIYDDCRQAERQQANQITSWLDASFVYGSSKQDCDELRKFNNGLMNCTLHPDSHPDHPFYDLLPSGEDASCRTATKAQPCFKTGDSRQNEQVGLIALHTVFVRYHNYIARNLNQRHPSWNDEQIFQESRRILMAVWQHIIYKEYLPSVIGPQYAAKFDLFPRNNGFYEGHLDDPETVHANIANVFSTAAFRFGHSQISDTFMLSDPSFQHYEHVPLTEIFFNPARIYKSGILNNTVSGVNAITLGMTVDVADKSDIYFTNQVAGSMFTRTPPRGQGMDLPAINTQRGRDHGLPGYTRWRNWSNDVTSSRRLNQYHLKEAYDFNDITDFIDPNSVEKLKSLYMSVEDVDLYTGAMLEDHVIAGMVGPTFASIMAKQFSELKIADRFFYENEGQFTPAQLANIRDQTLSSILCVTLEDDPDNSRMRLQLQPYVMLRPLSDVTLRDLTEAEERYLHALYYGSKNKRIPCKEHTEIDFQLF